MEYKQMERKKTYEMLTDQLKEMIVEGILKPGDRLDSVEQLAKNYSVSRSAIREALSALKAMGYIEIKQGHGTFVNASDLSTLTNPISSSMLLNKKDMIEFFEVRKIIESGTASTAAIRRTDENLLNMKHALEEMEQVGHVESLGEHADVAFHLAIAEATQNSVLIQLMHSISHTLSTTMLESRRVWLYSEEATLERLYQEHLSIYRAIGDQNASLAQELMLAHLRKVENVYLRFMNK